MALRTTPEQYVEKWGRRLKGATQDVRQGAERVTEAPGMKAAKAVDLMLSRLTEAITSGLWAKQVSAVSVEEWRKALIEKGIDRIAKGVDAASPAQAEMARKLLAAVEQAAAKARALPKGSIEDSINRAGTYMREMHKAKIRG